MASLSLKEAVRILTLERDTCIFELKEGSANIFDSYERKKIHAYNLVIDNITSMSRKGVLKWDEIIKYY